MLTVTRQGAIHPVYATGNPFEELSSAFVKVCNRCGMHYETASKRTPVMKLCVDCKDVCTATERRNYMTGR